MLWKRYRFLSSNTLQMFLGCSILICTDLLKWVLLRFFANIINTVFTNLLFYKISMILFPNAGITFRKNFFLFRFLSFNYNLKFAITLKMTYTHTYIIMQSSNFNSKFLVSICMFLKILMFTFLNVSTHITVFNLF